MSDFDLATLKIEVDTTGISRADRELKSLAETTKKFTATQIASQKEEDAYSRAGIKSLAERREKTTALSAAMKQLQADHAAGIIVGKEYNRMHHDIVSAQNLAIHGNARHRGAIRQTAAAMASLTFEMTGALYGVIALGGALAAPALFGTAMLKRVEDAQTGVAGILLSMGELNGKALTFGQAWAASGQYVKQVQQDSMKYGIDMGRLMEVNQAAISGGLNAMLTLEQVQKVATAGAIAVSSLGLSSQQYVQEVRDLISGGIQPASSTLARSIGVTDALLKQWKAEGPDKLVKELTDRLSGFLVVADEVRSKTLTGAWDILQARLSMLLSDEEGFGAIKKAVLDIANYIGTVDDVSKKFTLNPEAVATAKAYWEVLKLIGGVFGLIGDVLKWISPLLSKISQGMQILMIEAKILFTLVGTAVNQFLAFAKLDLSGFKKAGADGAENLKRMLSELDNSARAFSGMEQSANNAAVAQDELWKSITGGQDKNKKEIISTEQKLINSLKERLAVNELDLVQSEKLTASEKEAVKWMQKIVDGTYKGTEAQKIATAALYEQNIAKEKSIAADAELKKQLQDGIEYRNKYWNEIDKETASINEKAKQQEFENTLIGKTKEQIDALTKQRENDTIATWEQNLAITPKTEANAKEIAMIEEHISALKRKKAAEEGKTTADAIAESAKKATEEAKKQWEMIDGFAHTAFNNILDKGKNTFKEIGDAIKKYLLDMLYKMTVQKFLINIGVAGAGAGGAGGAMASMMGGDAGGGGSWLSAGKSFYDGLSGAFTYSSTATTGLSGMFNSFATSGLGQSLGLSTAGELSLATGEFAQSVSSLGSTVGTIGSYVGAGLAGISLGTMIAGDKKLFGIDGKSAAMMGTAIGMAVGGPLGAVVGGVIGGIANAAFGMGPKQSGTTSLVGTASQTGFAGQYQTPWSQKGGWFRSNKSGVDVQGIGAEQAQAFQNVIAGTEFVFAKLAAVSGEATTALDTWSFAINRQVATQEQQNQLVIDIANSMGAHMIPRLSQFQKEGENLADTAVRLSDEVILLNKLFYALSSTSRATMDSADQLANALGGVANSAQLMTSFISGFAPEARQSALTLESLTNAGLPMAQFLTTTEAWWAFAQTASTEQLTAILANQGAIKSWVDAMDKSSQAVKDNIKALQDRAVADFKAASDAVASLRTFGASVRDLMRSLWLGAQTPLSSTYGASRSEFISTNIAAAGGNVTAQGNLAGSATAFLDASKLQARSSVEYARDFAMVQNALGATADATDIQVTVADAQLTVLELISSTMTNLLAETAAGNVSNVVNLQESYAALLSVQNEINAAKIAGTLDVDVLRGTVISATAQQVSGVDNVNKSVLRITDPSGLLIGASNAIRTEVINGTGYTAKVTDTLNASTNPILDEMSAWLNSINTESTIQTDSLIYLLNTAIATNQAASDAANAQMAADAQKALVAQDAIRSATATAEAARIAAETAAAVATSLPNVYSASNPNPTLVAARDAAIATAQSAMDAAMMADYGRDYGGRARGRAISAAQATLTSAQSLPAFASGGIHEGGWRMVGENGPEIEYTPPSRIFSNSESRGMMAANDDTANEIKNLRTELQAIGLALAKNTGEAAKILRKFDGDGMPAERVIAA